MNTPATSLPLADVRVLDLTQMIAGPYCTLLLADAGAEVIKIERPGVGDLSRAVAPFIEDGQGRRISAYFMRFARYKKSLTLDLTRPRGQEIFLKLVRRADVVVENFRPGVMEKFGLGYAALREANPAIIYATISGFGHLDIYHSPYWDRPAFDIVAQAMSGLMEQTGQVDGPPTVMAGAVGDIFPAALTAYGIMVALHQRARTGQGQHLDIAMYDSLISLNERAVMLYGVTGQVMTRGIRTLLAPYGVYAAQDGFVVIAALSQEQWRDFCRAMGREDLITHPQLDTADKRADNDLTLLRPLIEAWTKDKKKHEVTEILLKHGVPAGPVQTAADLFTCPHAQARRMLIEMPHPLGGHITVAGRPVKLSAVPEGPAGPAPLLGQHTTEVLSTLLGLSAWEINKLREEGIA